MRVWIDQGLCSADGLCSETVPSVFAMGDDGVAHVLLPDGSLGTAVKRWHWYRRGRRGRARGQGRLPRRLHLPRGLTAPCSPLDEP